MDSHASKLATASPSTIEALRTQVRAERAQAQQLLAELMNAQGEPAEGSRPDLYKQVTGKSSLEMAVDQTRRLIDAHDRMLAQLDRRSAGEVVTTTMVAAWRAGAYAGIAG